MEVVARKIRWMPRSSLFSQPGLFTTSLHTFSPFPGKSAGTVKPPFFHWPEDCGFQILIFLFRPGACASEWEAHFFIAHLPPFPGNSAGPVKPPFFHWLEDCSSQLLFFLLRPGACASEFGQPGHIASEKLNYDNNGLVSVPPWATVPDGNEVCGRAGCGKLVGSRGKKCALCKAQGKPSFGELQRGILRGMESSLGNAWNNLPVGWCSDSFGDD